MRVLMLASDAHGGRGGIAQYNRDAISALAALERIEEILVLPRLVEHAEFALPPRVRYDMKAARGRLWFVWRAFIAAMRGGRFAVVFCGHINLLPVAVLAALLLRAKLVLAVHGTDVWTPPRSLLARLFMPRVDLILSVSQFTLERMSSWVPDVRDRATVVPNTVDLERFGLAAKDAELVRRLGLDGKRVIMTLGRMAADERAKGFDEVIELMPQLLSRDADLVYLCVGDGDDRPRLQAKAAGLGLGNSVIFTGSVPEAAKPDYFRLADAYVMASRGEGFGIVLLEALACGIPVLGSTADATQEALLYGELGPAVDPGNCDELAAAIMTTLKRPRSVPPLLAHYDFENFQRRMGAAFDAVSAT